MKPSLAIGTDWPPSWNILPYGISTGRYTDPAFTRLEHEKLWKHVWQVAARLDEIPRVGDYTQYDIGDQSILVVRAEQDAIKAYYNSCPHRGTALVRGAGSFASGRIMCPFHGWRWNLAGRNQFVLERQEFCGGQLRDSDAALKEVKSAVFAGFVFINMDPECGPFDEFIAPLRPLLEDMSIADMHHHWWNSISVDANWKVAQEAFFETFHVPATHPQIEKDGSDMLLGKRDDAVLGHRFVNYETLLHGHARFFVDASTPMSAFGNEPAGDPVDAMASQLKILSEGMDAMIFKEDIDTLFSLRGKPVPEGSNLGAEFVKALYAAAAQQNRPMPKPIPEAMKMWGGEVFIFPNIMILPYAGNAMIYRVRPNGFDPNSCVFEIFSTRTLPADTKPERSTPQHVTDVRDASKLRLIPRQDLSNIPRVQRGIRTQAFDHILLAEHQEKIILAMHRELDDYLR
jgi:phenylpropionate dioxygenase-like ring-hydroxylating dioxygenase large terminal subunit